MSKLLWTLLDLPLRILSGSFLDDILILRIEVLSSVTILFIFGGRTAAIVSVRIVRTSVEIV